MEPTPTQALESLYNATRQLTVTADVHEKLKALAVIVSEELVKKTVQEPSNA